MAFTGVTYVKRSESEPNDGYENGCYLFGDRKDVLSESVDAARQVIDRKRPGCCCRTRLPFSVMAVGNSSLAGEFSSISR